MSLREEIEDQPAVLEGLLRQGRRDVDKLAASLRAVDFGYVLVAARGTSDNAARYAQYLWGARNRLPVALAAPSLFGAYERPPVIGPALVVAISQSGQSPDLAAVLEEARRQGRPTIAITNDPESPLAGHADHVVDLRAGKEDAVAATKTYTAQLVAIAMLSAALAGDEEMRSALARIPQHVGNLLGQDGGIQPMAAGFRDADRCIVLGRGFNLSTAFEWALKIQELASIVAQPFSSADFEHGPIAVVGPGFPVLAVCPPGPLREGIERLLLRLGRERGARLVTIAGQEERAGDRQRILVPADVPEWLWPVPAIVGAICSPITSPWRRVWTPIVPAV